MRFCKHCKQWTKFKRDWSVIEFILYFITGWFFCLIFPWLFLPWLKPLRCSSCGAKINGEL